MPLWTLTPSTTRDDPRWADADVYPRTVVNAGTSGQARALAAEMEAERIGYDPERDQVGTQAMKLPSAFLDPMLYDVVRTAEAEGEWGVVEFEAPVRGASADTAPG